MRIPPAPDTALVAGPLQVHLRDGGIAVFPDGVRAADGALRGSGVLYTVGLRDTVVAGPVPLDSVLGIVAHTHHIDSVKTLAANALMVGGLLAAGALLPKECVVCFRIGAPLAGSR